MVMGLPAPFSKCKKGYRKRERKREKSEREEREEERKKVRVSFWRSVALL